MVRLLFSDGHIDLDETIIPKFKLIQMVTEDCETTEIPVTNVDRSTTEQLVHFARQATFTVEDPNQLLEIALAANYYDYQESMDEACKQIATFLNDKSPQFIRGFLGLVA